MKSLKRVYPLILVTLLSLFIVNCEKVDPRTEMLDDPATELNSSQLKAIQVESSDEINYLLGLIETIKSMVEDGLLNKGQANALISKMENAIKSLDKGNPNAAIGQLNALINQVEDFVDNSVLTVEQGEILINVAENGINMIDGNNISLDNTTWDFTINWSETISWHADVTFNADGTTIYDEPEYPGIYTFYGTWSLNGNVLEYIMDSSGSLGANYQFTGTLFGTTMSGTFTLGDGTRIWSATLRGT